jgi:phospho-N-acetylmuramoyl-pentapeptide-transferase
VSGRVRLGSGFVVAAVPAMGGAAAPRPLTNQLAVPVFKDVLMNLGFLFVPFAMIVIVGAANAVNLTDGLDGLAIMPVMIAAGTLRRDRLCRWGASTFTDYLGVHYVPGTGENPDLLRGR